jgi:hypothetical protein
MTITNSNTVLTYALLSDAAYKGGLLPIGWTFIESRTSTSSTGFAAIAVQNRKGDRFIFYNGKDVISLVQLKQMLIY